MTWIRSSFCGSNACVEVSKVIDLDTGETRIAVRDSKDLGSPELEFTADEWTAFVAGVRAGDFDLLAVNQ